MATVQIKNNGYIIKTDIAIFFILVREKFDLSCTYHLKYLDLNGCYICFNYAVV